MINPTPGLARFRDMGDFTLVGLTSNDTDERSTVNPFKFIITPTSKWDFVPHVVHSDDLPAPPHLSFVMTINRIAISGSLAAVCYNMIDLVGGWRRTDWHHRGRLGVQVTMQSPAGSCSCVVVWQQLNKLARNPTAYTKDGHHRCNKCPFTNGTPTKRKPPSAPTAAIWVVTNRKDHIIYTWKTLRRSIHK